MVRLSKKVLGLSDYFLALPDFLVVKNQDPYLSHTFPWCSGTSRGQQSAKLYVSVGRERNESESWEAFIHFTRRLFVDILSQDLRLHHRLYQSIHCLYENLLSWYELSALSRFLCCPSCVLWLLALAQSSMTVSPFVVFILLSSSPAFLFCLCVLLLLGLWYSAAATASSPERTQTRILLVCSKIHYPLFVPGVSQCVLCVILAQRNMFCLFNELVTSVLGLFSPNDCAAWWGDEWKQLCWMKHWAESLLMKVWWSSW